MVITDKGIPGFICAEKSHSSLRQALPQILAVCVKNVLLLGFGMTLGFPTILIPSLSGNSPEERFHLGQEAISWIGSINLICVPIGCLMSGPITQPIGRKRAMQSVNIPFLAAWLLFYFSTEVWQVFLALAITGVTGGLLEAPVLTYVAEITQPHLRGILSSTSSMSVILGVLSQFLLGTFLNWRQVATINCLIPLVSFILLIFVPETPIWLMSKGRYLDARKSIAWLRGWTSLDTIEAEFQSLHGQMNQTTSHNEVTSSKSRVQNLQAKLDVVRLLCKKNFLWPYGIVAFTFFLGHFNGMTTLQTYAIKLFASLNSPIDKYYATVLLGVVEMLGCLVCVTLVHFTGKRLINFVSLLGCGTCFLIVATYAHIYNLNYIRMDDDNINDEIFANNWIPTTFLIGSAFLSHVGIKVLPWILTGEVFSNETRAVASGLAAAIGYVLGFIANKIFLGMIEKFTLPGTFWVYSAISYLGIIVLYFILPETEGKTLYDITEHFSGKRKLGNHVQRGGKNGGEINKGFQPDEPERQESTLTYVAEITEPRLRGVLSATGGIAVIGGILIQFSLGTFLNWRIVALISCVAPVASFLLLFFVPDSPHWLIVKGRLQDAQHSIAWLRGWRQMDEVKDEFDDLCKQLGRHPDDELIKLTLMQRIRLFTEKKFYWPFSVVGFAFFLSHFTGTSTLQVYAVKIFSTLRVPINKYYATVMLGVAEICGCIACTCVIHRLGKRILNFIGLIGCGTGFFIVATYAYLNSITSLVLDGNGVEDRLESATSWLIMFCLIGTAFFTHMGIKTLPWLLTGEVYYHEIRAMASGMSGALSYVFGFIASKIYLTMIAYLTLPGIFWFYSSVCFTGMIVLYFILPETEGKTLYDITEHFAGNSQLDNKVLRYGKAKYNNGKNELNPYVNNGFEIKECKL